MLENQLENVLDDLLAMLSVLSVQVLSVRVLLEMSVKVCIQ